MKKVVLGLGLVLASASSAFAAALHEVYSQPAYMYGPMFDGSNYGSMLVVPKTDTLIFPDATIKELENLDFTAYFEQDQKRHGYCSHLHKYEKDGVLQWLLVTVQRRDWNTKKSYSKATSIQLWDGEGGVWGKTAGAGFVSEWDDSRAMDYDFVKNIDADGNITWQNGGAPGSGYNYDYKGFTARKWVKADTPTLMFANGDGESILTVNDLRNYRFSGEMVGPTITPKYWYEPVAAQNVFMTKDENGVVTKIRLEMQMMDVGSSGEKYLKCAIVELTDGEGGVWAQDIDAYYIYVTGADAWVSLGYKFINDDGSVNYQAKVLDGDPAYLWKGGYGVVNLSAVVVNEKNIALDGSKTWSELVGSSDPVDNDKLDICVSVTAPDAVLTFDVPIHAHSIVVSSEENHPITYALAANVTAPDIALWDSRGTTGRITFNGFTPVRDAVTDNILPNTASTVAFNGPTSGQVPFNAAITVPCAGIALGDGAALDGFGFNKVKALTVDGEVTFRGNVTGTGTITLTADGSLDFTNALTIASTVRFVVPDDTECAVRLLDETVKAFPVAATQVTGGSFVLAGGTRACASGAAETWPATGAGGTLAITVTDAQKSGGYVSLADLRDGGTICFYDTDGNELGVGRPQMAILPGSDVAWTPTDGGDNTFSTDANWSSGATPAEGDVAVSDGGRAGGATVALVAAQGFNQVSIRSGSTIAFVASGDGLLSATKLAVADHATVTIPLAATSIAAVELGEGATLRVVGDEMAQDFAATVTGAGRVEYVTGEVTPTASNSYGGGTVVKPGAYVRMGHNFALGAQGGTVKVEDGGTLDPNDTYSHQLALDLCGDGVTLANGVLAGALRSTGTRGYNSAQFTALTLSGDASICVDGETAAVGFVPDRYAGSVSVNFNSYALTKTGAGTLYFASKNGVAGTGSGKVVVAGGTVQSGFYTSSSSHQETPFAASSATLEIQEGAQFVAYGNLTFKKIDNDGRMDIYTSFADMTVTVSDSYVGNGAVHKYGDSKTAYVPFNNGCHSTWTVHGGRLCPSGKVTPTPGSNTYAFNTPENPSANPKVVVENTGNDKKAKFDFNGVDSVTLNLVLSGYLYSDRATDRTALCSGSKDILDGKMQVTQLTLADDARVGGPCSFGLVAPGHNETLLELGDRTMTLCLAEGKNFWLYNTTVTGTGNLLVESGTAYFNQGGLQGTDWTLEVGVVGSAQFVTPVTVSNLVFRGTATGTAGVTAYGTYAPLGSSLPKVTLTGAGAGLDLSEKTETFELPSSLSFAAGTSVKVFTGDRELKNGDQLVSWNSKPGNVTRWTLSSTDEKGQRMHVRATKSGLFTMASGFVIILK